MSEALAALLGAVVGALSSIATTYWATNRHERLARDHAAEQQRSEWRLAARLIDAELFLAAAALEYCQEQQGWPAPAIPNFALKAWDTHASTLAAIVEDNTWEILISAVSMVRIAGQTAAHGSWDSEDPVATRDAVSIINQARDELGKFARPGQRVILSAGTD